MPYDVIFRQLFPYLYPFGCLCAFVIGRNYQFCKHLPDIHDDAQQRIWHQESLWPEQRHTVSPDMDREFPDSLPCIIDSLVYYRNHIHTYCKVAQRSFPIHIFRCMAVIDNSNDVTAVDFALSVYKV